MLGPIIIIMLAATTIPSDQSNDSVNRCRRGHFATGIYLDLLLLRSQPAPQSLRTGSGMARPCRDIDWFRSAALPEAVSDCDVAYWVLNASLREGTLWDFLIKRAWAVLAILQHSSSGHLVSGRDFFFGGGTRGYQLLLFPALDMMILRMAVYFAEQVERERGFCFISFASVVRACCCCVEIWWIPRGICKLI